MKVCDTKSELRDIKSNDEILSHNYENKVRHGYDEKSWLYNTKLWARNEKLWDNKSKWCDTKSELWQKLKMIK